MNTLDELSKAYVKIAFEMEHYIPGIVDAYFGPENLKDSAQKSGKQSIESLLSDVQTMIEQIEQMRDQDAARKQFLLSEFRALHALLRIVHGEKLSVSEAAQALFDIIPEYVNESVFEEALLELDELLPPGESIRERNELRKKGLRIPAEDFERIVQIVLDEVKIRTKAKFELPNREHIEIEIVRDKFWLAYNWYLGNYRSRIEFNVDQPFHIHSITEIVAHETYPGHHSEHAMKEQMLFREKGFIEHSIIPVNTPQSVISEGIATMAISIIMPTVELIDWHSQILFPAIHLKDYDAEREERIMACFEAFRDIVNNAVFLKYDQRLGDEELKRYLLRYSLMSEVEVNQSLRWLNDPLWRIYGFTYTEGRRLLTELFEKRGQQDDWFGRLISEPVTPGQIRKWISNGGEA